MSSKRITKYSKGIGVTRGRLAVRQRSQKAQIKKLRKDVNKLKKAQEYKYRDSVMSLSMTTAHPVVDLGLGQINQGDGVHDRDGSTILLTSLKVRGYINYADSSNKYRLIIFRVYDVDHTMPGIQSNDILESTTDWFNSFYKKNSVVSFKILKDIRGWLNKPGWNTNTLAYESTSNPTHRNFSCNLKFKKGLKIKYDTSSAGFTEPNQNAIYMMLLADSYASDHPDANLVSRVTFIDN